MATTISNDLEGILRTLAQLYAAQGKRREVAILAKSKAELEQTEYDNWNGGTYTYRLLLRLASGHYAQVEGEHEQIEADILKRLGALLRGYTNEYIGSVVISLEMENDINWRKNATRWLDKSDSETGRPALSEARFDAFISHASEDKDALVRPLAKSLTNQGLKVWYDEFELKLGDSLSRSIDRGLANSSYGIVVLSPAFFAKNWPRYELEGLTAKQMVGEKVLLPIWHGVGRNDILQYSPPLADRLAIDSTKSSIEEMVSAIASAIGAAGRGGKR